MFESCLRNSKASHFDWLFFVAASELFTCSQSQFFQSLRFVKAAEPSASPASATQNPLRFLWKTQGILVIISYGSSPYYNSVALMKPCSQHRHSII